MELESENMNKHNLFIATGTAITKSWTESWIRSVYRIKGSLYSFYSVKRIIGPKFGIMFLNGSITEKEFLNGTEWNRDSFEGEKR